MARERGRGAPSSGQVSRVAESGRSLRLARVQSGGEGDADGGGDGDAEGGGGDGDAEGGGEGETDGGGGDGDVDGGGDGEADGAGATPGTAQAVAVSPITKVATAHSFVGGQLPVVEEASLQVKSLFAVPPFWLSHVHVAGGGEGEADGGGEGDVDGGGEGEADGGGGEGEADGGGVGGAGADGGWPNRSLPK